MIITEEGIHGSIDARWYHEDSCPEPSLSNSLIKTLVRQTPRHAWLQHPRLNPDFERNEDTGASDLGSAAHALLLEGIDSATVVDADSWRTTAARKARDEARQARRVPLLTDEYDTVRTMVLAALEYVDASRLRGLFANGSAEQVLVWRHGSVWCRARPDFISDDRKLIVDYKTTSARSPGEFIRRQMLDLGYDTQSVFYPMGLSALGHEGARFLFLVQEVRAPYLCYLVEPAETMKALAHAKVARAISLWGNCLASDSWPGYSDEVYQAEAPGWAIQDEESQL